MSFLDELDKCKDEYEKHCKACEHILLCKHDYSGMLGPSIFETWETLSNLLSPEGISFEQNLRQEAQIAHDCNSNPT